MAIQSENIVNKSNLQSIWAIIGNLFLRKSDVSTTLANNNVVTSEAATSISGENPTIAQPSNNS